MSSRSAVVLVIFIVAVLAFCFASVFAAMTGPISILPDNSDNPSIFDNLSSVTVDSGDGGSSYDYPDQSDYSSDYDSSSDDVETTTDDSQDSDNTETTTDSGSSESDSSSVGGGSASSPSDSVPSSGNPT